MGLGLTADAEHVFNEVLSSHPTDVEAKLGRAAVLGAQGRPLEEIAAYRSLLEEEPARTDVRAHLVAALVDLPDWMLAQAEIEKMLSATPEIPAPVPLLGGDREERRSCIRGTRTGSGPLLGTADRDRTDALRAVGPSEAAATERDLRAGRSRHRGGHGHLPDPFRRDRREPSSSGTGALAVRSPGADPYDVDARPQS